MDDRCREFQAAAEARLPGDKLAREIASLRRFLFKNQGHRFTQGGQEALRCAIAAHHANPAAHAASTPAGEPLVYGLLDDALKMPFTVFTTAHKQQFLRWFFAMAPEGEGGAPAKSPPAPPRRLACIDVTGDFLVLLDEDTGDTREDVRAPAGARAAIADAVARGDDVAVDVSAAGEAVGWSASPPAAAQ